MQLGLHHTPWQQYFREVSQPAAMPQHALAALARAAFMAQHTRYSPKGGPLIDRADLMQQCLMRLWLLQPREYIKGGGVVMRQWAGVTYHEATSTAALDQTVIADIYQEQYALLAHLYYGPEAVLFSELSSMLGNEPGCIQRSHGAAYLVTHAGRRQVKLCPVDAGLAGRILRSFHFIHDNRPKAHYVGLYVAGCAVPFSVLAIEPVDDVLRTSALARYGLDYRRTFRFTRLYSAPNAPKNTTSAMFAEAIKYLRQTAPRPDAYLSSLLPTYSNGGSMFGSSFTDVLYAMPFYHFYKQTPHGYLPVTSSAALKNKTQLLPLLELIRPTHQGRAMRTTLLTATVTE